MKRFILILSVMMLTQMSANALHYTSVGTLGYPTHVVSHGRSIPISNFGSNALFLPRNTHAAGHAIRMRENMRYAQKRGGDRFARHYGYRGGYYNQTIGYNNSVNTSKPAQMSRFDRNYQVPPTRKTYTRNGITYFE